MFLVFKNPFKYAVAGYGVFNWVNGGVMKSMVGFNGTDLWNCPQSYRKFILDNSLLTVINFIRPYSNSTSTMGTY